MPKKATDYLLYYDDEAYILDVVGPRFRRTGRIEAVDFYMILIWKANRAKRYHRERLKKLVNGRFSTAVKRLALSVWESKNRKVRLQVLMDEWWFSLPTASAILTALYPEEFTVYDYRVRAELGGRRDFSQRAFSNALWAEYEEYETQVRAATPKNLSLRDKDRFLTARSMRRDAVRDCRA